MESDEEFTSTPYRPGDDFEMLQEWCRYHKGLLVKDWLPRTGIVIYQYDLPIMGLWLYFDPSCETCIVEWVVTRPALNPWVGKRALCWAVDGPIREQVRNHACSSLMVRTGLTMSRMFRGVPGWGTNWRELIGWHYFYDLEKLYADL